MITRILGALGLLLFMLTITCCLATAGRGFSLATLIVGLKDLAILFAVLIGTVLVMTVLYVIVVGCINAMLYGRWTLK